MGFEFSALGGVWICRFNPDASAAALSSDEAVRIARHVVWMNALANVSVEGVGLEVELHHVSVGGTPMRVGPDRAPQSQSLSAEDVNRIGNTLGLRPRLRYAVQDFNGGLLRREDAPFLFYRAVETLARDVLADTDGNGDIDWLRFHRLLGTTREQMVTLEEFGGSHRHGDHGFFRKEQHLVMLAEIRHFLDAYFRWLDKNG